MKERIDRAGDENLYQPKIHSRRIRELYSLRQETGKPMTVLIDQALRNLTESYSTENMEEPAIEEVREESWEEISEYRRYLDWLDYQKWLAELEKSNG